MSREITYHHLDPDTVGLLEHATVFDHPIRPDQMAAFLDDTGHELVFALAHDTIAGFAAGTILLHPDKAPAFFVNEVAVEPAYRRSGIGIGLCTRLFGMARRRGCRGIWLATEEDNVAARALYRRLGARETPGIVVYDWDGAMDG